MNRFQNDLLKKELEKFLKGFAYKETEAVDVSESKDTFVDEALVFGKAFESMAQSNENSHE